MQPGNEELTAAGVVEDYMKMPTTEDHDFLKFWKRYEAKAGDSRAKLALLAVARRSV